MATVVPSRAAHTASMSENAQKPNLTWCQPCGERLLELKRQALKFLMIEYHKVVMLNPVIQSHIGPLFYSVYEQLRLPDSLCAGIENGNCDSCGTYVETLKRQAIHALQSVNIAPFLPRNLMHALGQPADRTSTHQMRWQGTQANHGTHVGTKGNHNTPDSPKKSQGRQEMSGNNLNSEEMGRHRRQAEEGENGQNIPAAAALFFAKAAQKFNIPTKKKTRRTVSRLLSRDPSRLQYDIQEEREDKALFPTNFSDLIEMTPPPKPAGLFKYTGRRVDGKVKVMLRVAPDTDNDNPPSHLKVDQRRRQVTLLEPKTARGDTLKSGLPGPAPPKMFAFDAIFEPSASQHEITSTALLDVLHAVINGGDGSLLVFGGGNTGKTRTMVGSDHSVKHLGAIPCAITWLYNLIEDSKQRTGARFSVRVSAIEIVGKSEHLKDLLAEQASGGSSTSSSGTSPGIYLREDPICGVQLSNVSELRAPTADKAAFYLDAALAMRTTVPTDADDAVDITEYQGSHMIYTLHVYQYRIDRGSRSEVHGGRSRLYLIDLSAWERGAFRDCLSHSAPSQGSLGAVIVAMLNGMKQYPCRDSKITRLLKDSVGNMACRTTVVAHVSSDKEKVSGTLGTIQLAAKIQRSRRRRNKVSAGSSSNESSCDETFGRRRPTPAVVLTYGIDDNGMVDPSTSDYTSSAGEESCDTVIYVGEHGRESDRDFTDNEGPPDFLKEEQKCTDSSEKETCTDDNQNIIEVARRSPHPRTNNSAAVTSVTQRILTPSTLERMRAEALSLERIDVKVPDHPVHPTTSSPDFLPKVSAYDGNSRKSLQTRPFRSEVEQTTSGKGKDTRIEDVHNLTEMETNTEEKELGQNCLPDVTPVPDDKRMTDTKFFPQREEREQNESLGIYEGEKNGNMKEEYELAGQQTMSCYDRSPAIVHSQFETLESRQELNPADIIQYGLDEDDSTYSGAGTISEKELRKKEKRLKKLLKEKLKQHKAAKRAEMTNAKHQGSENDSGCLSDQEQGTKYSSVSKVEREGYFSAPETTYELTSPEKPLPPKEGIDKFWKIDFGNSSFDSNSDSCNLKADCTKNILKNYVAMKLEEKRLSSSASECSHSHNQMEVTSPDLQRDPDTAEVRHDVSSDSPQPPLTPCVARLQFVKTNTACITSTKTYRGSMTSLVSDAGVCNNVDCRERSASKDSTMDKMSEDSISIVSETDSTISSEVSHRRRGPAKICYRWSTVYEEEEKSKHSKNKSKSGTDSNISTPKSTEREPSTKGRGKKKEHKNAKKNGKVEEPGVSSPPATPKRYIDLKQQTQQQNLSAPLSPQLSERGSGSICSDTSSGIVSNSPSTSSDQSLPGCSVIGSPGRDKVLIRPEEQEPFSPRTKRWFFGREKKGKGRHHSGYVSDGSLTDSSRASWRSRGLFGSKSRLSSHGHSSGYESMRTDGGITSNASGNESAGENVSTKRKKRRFLGFRRRSTSDLSRKGRSKGSYWIDNAAIFSDNEDIEYKLYNIEDIDGVIPSPRARSDSDPAGGYNGKQARLLETHRRRVAELRNQREKLAAELDQAMEKLMLDKNRYKVAGSARSNPDHPHYASELEREVGLFHRRLRVLKAHLEMITCFDRLKFHRCTSI